MRGKSASWFVHKDGALLHVKYKVFPFVFHRHRDRNIYSILQIVRLYTRNIYSILQIVRLYTRNIYSILQIVRLYTRNIYSILQIVRLYTRNIYSILQIVRLYTGNIYSILQIVRLYTRNIYSILQIDRLYTRNIYSILQIDRLYTRNIYSILQIVRRYTRNIYSILQIVRLYTRNIYSILQIVRLYTRNIYSILQIVRVRFEFPDLDSSPYVLTAPRFSIVRLRFEIQEATPGCFQDVYDGKILFGIQPNESSYYCIIRYTNETLSPPDPIRECRTTSDDGVYEFVKNVTEEDTGLMFNSDYTKDGTMATVKFNLTCKYIMNVG
ncbi:hypothetical protein BaRGS_00024544 [Batillaria attramentaria]|uniref:Uncharacterized protein n=1 Tax=Batillaria attramentaria TaxID=370345 RepID=A0ABD0KAR6_9CAEN